MISLFPERRNLLKRCKIILLFNLPSDLCCWSRGGGKSSSNREVLLKKRVLDTSPGEFDPQMKTEAALSFDLLWPDFLDASLDFACWCLQKSASWKNLSFFVLKYWVFLLCWCFTRVNQDVQFIQKLFNVDKKKCEMKKCAFGHYFSAQIDSAKTGIQCCVLVIKKVVDETI